MTRLAVSVLSALFSLSNVAAPEIEGPQAGLVACREPANVLDLSARVVSSTDLGSTVRIEVDLSIVPQRNVPSARVRGAIAHGPGFDEAFGLPDEIVSLTRGTPRHQYYELEIPKGQVHHFVFSVRAEETGVPGAPASTAYLRVNLDPAQEPEERDGLLQYRANMVGE